jgi:hypothetical protein
VPSTLAALTPARHSVKPPWWAEHLCKKGKIVTKKPLTFRPKRHVGHRRGLKGDQDTSLAARDKKIPVTLAGRDFLKRFDEANESIGRVVDFEYDYGKGED